MLEKIFLKTKNYFWEQKVEARGVKSNYFDEDMFKLL
jgi:hypothetical protein